MCSVGDMLANLELFPDSSITQRTAVCSPAAPLCGQQSLDSPMG